MMNNDVRYANGSDTSPNERPTERPVNFNEVIRSFRTLSTEKKDEYVRLYMEMCWKNPASHVTLDQQTELFKQIGIPIQPQQQQPPPTNFIQDKELSNSATEVDEQKTKDFVFKVPVANQLKQRHENIACPVNESMDCHIEAPSVGGKENMTNSRMTSRRCTTYFRK